MREKYCTGKEKHQNLIFKPMPIHKGQISVKGFHSPYEGPTQKFHMLVASVLSNKE